MNRQQAAIVVGVVILLVGFSVFLVTRDRQNVTVRPALPDSKVFHTATWLSPAKSGGKRILQFESLGKIFRIPEDLILIGPVPTTSFTLQLVWPEWVPISSTGADSVKDGVDIHVQLDPKKGQRTGRNLLNWVLADVGTFEPPIRLEEFPGYLVYPPNGYQNSGNVGTAYYESTRSDGVTPEGDPIVFRCNKGKGKDGGDWTLCRGQNRIFGDLLITVDFFGEHINDGTDIFLKSMELIQSLVEVKS